MNAAQKAPTKIKDKKTNQTTPSSFSKISKNVLLVIAVLLGLFDIYIIFASLSNYFKGYLSICSNNNVFVPKDITLGMLLIVFSLVVIGLLIGLKKFRGWAYLPIVIVLLIGIGLLVVIINSTRDPNLFCGAGY